MFKKIVKNYRIKIFLICLAISLIPTSLFVVVIQNVFITTLYRKSVSALDMSTQSLALEIDNSYNQMKTIADGFLIEDISKYNLSPDKPVQVENMKKRLKLLISGNTVFDEISYWDISKEYVTSSISTYTKDRFLYLKGLDYMDAVEFESLFSGTRKAFILKSNEMSGGLQAVFPMHSGEGCSAMIFSFTGVGLEQRVKRALLNNTGFCDILDSDGNILVRYVSNGLEINESAILACREGKSIYRENGSVWYCACSKSSALGLTFVVVAKEGSLHSTATSVLVQWASMVILMILMCLVETATISQFSSSPIIRINKKVSMVLPDADGICGEVEQINRSIDYLQEYKRKMEKKMTDLSDFLTYRLFCGKIESIDEANQLSTLMETSLFADSYQVCIIRLNDELSSREAFAYLHSLYPAHVSCLVRPYGDAYACVLLFAANDENCVDVFCDMVLNEYPDGKMALGNVCNTVKQIPISFSQAIYQYNVQTDPLDEFVCPEVFEELQNTIRSASESGNIPDMVMAVSELALSLEQHKLNLHQGRYAGSYAVCSLIAGALREKVTCELPDVFKIHEYTSRREIAALLNVIIEGLPHEQMVVSEESVKTDISEQMKEYLFCNYKNPDFTIYQMALQFQQTPSSVNYYFKKHVGMSVSEYINVLRMNQAKELLSSTNMPVYQVGLALGYQGPNSFNRRFKASFGVTPGEYRVNLMAEQNTESDSV